MKLLKLFEKSHVCQKQGLSGTKKTHNPLLHPIARPWRAPGELVVMRIVTTTIKWNTQKWIANLG